MLFHQHLIGASSRHFRAIRETPLLWQLVQRIGVKYVPRVRHAGEILLPFCGHEFR
jgi:hypothetical protein